MTTEETLLLCLARPLVDRQQEQAANDLLQSGSPTSKTEETSD